MVKCHDESSLLFYDLEKWMCGCVDRWSGCSKIVTVGEHRWGVYGCWEVDGGRKNPCSLFLLLNKNPQDGSRGTLLEGASLQPFIRWPYFLIWKAGCEDPTKDCFCSVNTFIWKVIQKYEHDKMPFGCISLWIAVVEINTILLNLIHKTSEMYLKCCVN